MKTAEVLEDFCQLADVKAGDCVTVIVNGKEVSNYVHHDGAIGLLKERTVVRLSKEGLERYQDTH